MRDFWKHLLAMLGIIATVGAAYAGARTIGLELPRPAWNHEVGALEKQIVGLDARTQQMITESIQRQVWSLEDRIVKKGETQSDRERLRRLQKQLREAESQLKAIRGY